MMKTFDKAPVVCRASIENVDISCLKKQPLMMTEATSSDMKLQHFANYSCEQLAQLLASKQRKHYCFVYEDAASGFSAL